MTDAERDLEMFPIQMEWPEHEYPPQLSAVPWDLIAPHEEQAKANHCGQDLKKLAHRQGVSACEAVAILEDKRFMERWPAVNTREEIDAYHIQGIRRLREINDRWFSARNAPEVTK